MPAASEAIICNMALARIGLGGTISSLNDPTPAARACNTFYAQCRDSLLAMARWPFAIRRAILTNFTGSLWDGSVAYNVGDNVQWGDGVYEALTANSGQQPDQNLTNGTWRQLTRDGWAFAALLPVDFISGIQAYNQPSAAPGAAFPGYRRGYSSLRTPRNDQRTSFTTEDANDGSGLQLFLSDLEAPVLQYVAQITLTQSFPPIFISALAWLLAIELIGPLRADVGRLKEAQMAFQGVLAEAISAMKRGEQDDPEPISEFEAAREGDRWANGYTISGG